MRVFLSALLILALGSVSVSQTAAPVTPGPVTLRPVISEAVAALAKRPPSGRVGLLVRDLQTGEVVEALRPDELFTPASTMKLVSMAARLTQSGPGSRYTAEVTAPAADIAALSAKADAPAGRLGSLTLRGGGDPSLGITGTYSLSALARQLYAKGVRQVGEVRLSGTLDSATWPALPLGTPVASLRLDGEPGWNDTPAGYAARIQRAFEGQLRRAGIRVVSAGRVRLGEQIGQMALSDFVRVSETAPAPLKIAPEQPLARVTSAPLSELVRQTLKPSSNVWSEQLAAALGVPEGGKADQIATHAGMVAGLRRFLNLAGVNAAPLELHDASGLSASNRLTPRTLVTVLRRMYDLPTTVTSSTAPLTPVQVFIARKNLFIEALPRGGTGTATPQARAEGGTLAGRFVGSGLDVRAKTGTLEGVSCLSGYVRGKSGHVLAFALMLDGASGSAPELRAYQDKLLRVIAAGH